MNIIFSHCTQSFPIRFSASNTKADYLARGLFKAGATITFINGIEGSDVDTNKTIRYHGFDCYLYSKKYCLPIRMFVNIVKLIGLLAKLKRKNDINVLFTGGRLPIYLIQLVFAKIFGYKCVILTQEWVPALTTEGIFSKIECYFAVNLYGKCLNIIFPISHFLYDKYKKFNKPMHIIPILADFSSQPSNSNRISDHFAYCAGAEYFRVLQMLLDAYKKFIDRGGTQRFILVLYGRKEAIKKVYDYIHQLGLSDVVTIKQQISNEELLEIYKTSLGLFIPLDPNSVQDQARFSQKIAEYLSTCRPIVTCNVGEIPYYFTSGKDSIIVDYDAESFAMAMEYLSKNIEKANLIGNNGFETGKRYFDCYKNGKIVYEFIKSNV